MQPHKKTTITCLLNGGFIRPNYPSGYRVLDSQCNPVVRISKVLFKDIELLLRKRKDATFVINKTEVRKLNGKTFTKKLYRHLLKQRKASSS